MSGQSGGKFRGQLLMSGLLLHPHWPVEKMLTDRRPKRAWSIHTQLNMIGGYLISLCCKAFRWQKCFTVVNLNGQLKRESLMATRKPSSSFENLSSAEGILISCSTPFLNLQSTSIKETFIALKCNTVPLAHGLSNCYNCYVNKWRHPIVFGIYLDFKSL